MTESESQTAIMDTMSGRVTTSCATESTCPPSRLATVQRVEVSGVCTDDGECVGSPELRLLRRNLLTVTSGIGRDTQTRKSQD